MSCTHENDASKCTPESDCSGLAPNYSGNNINPNSSDVFAKFESYDEDIGDGSEQQPLLCGFWSCTPKWLQKFHTAKSLLLVLGICAFVQSFVVNAIFPVGLSTLEKQFNMTSTETGIISSWYDFAVLCFVFIVCHFGNSGHKGRWIGCGGLIMALGSFVCFLPHYISPIYTVDEILQNQTQQTDIVGQCTHSPSSPAPKCQQKHEVNVYFLIFLLGQTFHGIGATPIFSIGNTYLDENVSQKASPLYLATHSLLTTLGTIIGLFAGAFLLNIYVDFDRIDGNAIRIRPSDPRWIGAWWIGFLSCSIVAVIASIPILMFARELPEAQKHRRKDINQVHAASIRHKSREILEGRNVKLLPKAIRNILRNPTFFACIIIGTAEAIITNGFSAFMPKILETILSTTPTIGSYLSSLVIFAAATGIGIGGIIVRKMALQVPGMLKMLVICHVIALSLISSMLIQCPSRRFVGINTKYDAKDEGDFTLTTQCNSECNCDERLWNPVCDPTTKNIYYSPCFAGCKRRKIKENKVITWADCSCNNIISNGNDTKLANDQSLMSYSKNKEYELVQGFCVQHCGTSMYIFLLMLFFSVVASFAAGIPSQQIMLRVVPFQQRTLGIGVNWTFLRLFGYIPGGIIFGLIIDTTCVKWRKSTCGTRQNCLVYDSHRVCL